VDRTALIDHNRSMFHGTAHVYDLLYEAAGKDYAGESAALHALVQARHPGAASLLDVACGTGAHLVHLRRWYDVVGVDVDAGMLDEARRRLPDAEFIEADLRSFGLGRRFDAVSCLFSSIGYLTSVHDLDQAVDTMVSHLGPGGVFVLDGWIRPDAWIDESPTHLLTASDANVTVARMSRSRRQDDKTFLDMHHLIGTRDGIEHLIDVHVMTLFTTEQYEASLLRAGLIDIETVESPMPDRDRFVGVTPLQ
jgi:SAM-dependent methyltransferase